MAEIMEITTYMYDYNLHEQNKNTHYLNSKWI